MYSEEKGTKGIEIRNCEKIKVKDIANASGGSYIDIPPEAVINRSVAFSDTFPEGDGKK